MMNRRSQLLDALAIGPRWTLRQPQPKLPVSESAGATVEQDCDPHLLQEVQQSLQQPVQQLVQPPAVPDQGNDDAIATMDWAMLQQAVKTCNRCALCETRTSTVFGSGDPKAAWLLVGEGPGRNEDLQGEPFIGPAGKLLDNMLASIALGRGQNVFIANVVKCRPTDATGKDRAPNPEEIAACRPYLMRQIALIGPRTILALGKTAAVTLLDCPPTTTLSKLRGTVHRYGTQPLIVTYHPAYLLRTLVDKRKSWEDLCLAVDVHAVAN